LTKPEPKTLANFVDSLPLHALDDLESQIIQRQRQDRIRTLFPDEGPLRRELYVKHMEFMRLGALDAEGEGVNERCFMAANRVGKTLVGAYETTCHLTGDYPSWWLGRKFPEPVDWWAAGDTSETTRDTVQLELLGPVEEIGTGMLPAKAILGAQRRTGVRDAIDTVLIRHASGGVSHLAFKSFDQGRKRFQGTKKHGVWLDEEPPKEIYDECLVRLMTTHGLMICTFTPLEGLTEVSLQFLPHLNPAAGEYAADQSGQRKLAPFERWNPK
jgi:phage terminase large subunit-like protein